MIKLSSIILCLLLIGCSAMPGSGYYYEKIDKKGNLYGEKMFFRFPTKTVSADQMRKNYDEVHKMNLNRFRTNYKKYCMYQILFLIPLNFWDIGKNSTSLIIQRTIRDLNKEGYEGNAMKDILFFKGSVELKLIFTSTCSGVSAGTLMTEN